jgi:hypothetical protein
MPVGSCSSEHIGQSQEFSIQTAPPANCPSNFERGELMINIFVGLVFIKYVAFSNGVEPQSSRSCDENRSCDETACDSYPRVQWRPHLALSRFV